jgi:PPM family protein phosphatase
MTIQSSAATLVGRRENNEDRFVLDRALMLFAVADGMGGHEGGEVASTIAVQQLREAVRGAGSADTAEVVLGAAMARTHAAVCAARRGRLMRMGSTLSAVLVRPGHAAIAHIGDSRVYRLRGGVLERLTRDHNMAEELRAQGMVLSEEAGMSHLLTRALGTEHAKPDLQRVALGEAVIAAVLAEWPIELVADELVQLAYEAGSADNITAVVVRI